MSEKVELSEKILAVDKNVREFWDALDETQQKALKGEFYILNRYISSVSKPYGRFKGKTPTLEEQAHHIVTVNEYFNKNWYAIQSHPKLQWLLLCMCSYDGDTQFFHEWISKPKVNNKKLNFLMEIYPNEKASDVELLCKIMTDEDIKELGQNHGMDKTTISKILK